MRTEYCLSVKNNSLTTMSALVEMTSIGNSMTTNTVHSLTEQPNLKTATSTATMSNFTHENTLHVHEEDHFVYYMATGSVLLVFSVWWLINILGRYFHATGKYESTTTYPCNCCPCGKNGVLEIEGIAKLLFSIAAVILSVLNHISRKHDGIDLPLIHTTNVKVTTIVIFFGAQGMIDVIAQASSYIPRGMEYIGCALCFFIEGIILGSIDWEGARLAELHQILVYIAYSTALCITMEMMWRHLVHLSFMKTGMVMLQGLWLWQISFRATSDEYSIALLLAWTLATIFGFMLISAFLIGAVYQCCGGHATTVDYYKYGSKDGAITQLIKKDSNGHTIINFNDESESETEFEQGLFKK